MKRGFINRRACDRSEGMEPKFSERIMAEKTKWTAPKVACEEAALAAIGGEPLAGSGFEKETPDPDFSEKSE